MSVQNPLLAVAGAAALGLVGLILATPAAAHDELTGSSPADGATVGRVPAAVTLYFEEPPAGSPIAVTVYGPAGLQVNSTAPRLDGSDITEELAGVNSAGAYSIAYRIMSDDGHPVSGTVHFTVGPGAGAAVVPGSARSDPGGHSRAPVWLAIGAGAVAAGALGLGRTAARRRRRGPAIAAVTPAPEAVPR
jgi:copper resistance protein C